MRAVVCERPEGMHGLKLVDLEAPAVKRADEVRIRVAAAGLNFADTLMMRGSYQVKPETPFIAGKELAGEVVEIGDDVRHVRVGDRVMATVEWGAFADEVVAEERDVYLIADEIDDIRAAGFPVAYGTAHFGLADRAQTRSGETVVVFGAAGGVGLTSVEVGKRMGARVIAVAGGGDRVALAREHGADEGIDYKTDDVQERIKQLTGGIGADVFVDPVGGTMFDAALRSVAPGGRILVVGFASGKIQQIPANLLLVKNVSVIGFTLGTWRNRAPDRLRATMAELVRWAAAGDIKPHVSKTFPVEDFARGYESLMRRETTGKVVLTF
ncbi:MAG: NADPH:quinone oxidoreductase family protein [Rhodospirillales bacterium]